MKNKMNLITIPISFLLLGVMIMFSSTPQASLNRPYGYWHILRPKELKR